MRSSITTILIIFAINYLNAQTQIGKDIIISGEAVLATNALITDNRTTTHYFDIVSLKGNGALKLAADWKINILRVDGHSELDGYVTIIDSLFLLNGEIEPNVNSQLLLDTSAFIVSKNQAFVNGALYRKGHGKLFFPTGKNGQYAPITYLDVPVEGSSIYGVEAFDHDLVLESLPNEIIQVSNEFYWKAHTGIPDSPIELNMTTTVKKLVTGEETLTLLQANEGLTEVVNLGASTELTTILSSKPFTGSHLFIGVQNNKALSINKHETTRVYPNPFTTELNIDALDERYHLLKVYSTRGTAPRVYELNGKKTLDTSSYPSGFYLLVFYSRSGNFFTMKMVRQ